MVSEPRLQEFKKACAGDADVEVDVDRRDDRREVVRKPAVRGPGMRTDLALELRERGDCGGMSEVGESVGKVGSIDFGERTRSTELSIGVGGSSDVGDIVDSDVREAREADCWSLLVSGVSCEFSTDQLGDSLMRLPLLRTGSPVNGLVLNSSGSYIVAASSGLLGGDRLRPRSSDFGAIGRCFPSSVTA